MRVADQSDVFFCEISQFDRSDEDRNSFQISSPSYPRIHHSRLQRVKNCLVRLVKLLPRRSPTSSAIRSMGWLRLEERISFKVCCFVYKCIYGSAPSYVNNLVALSRSGANVVLRSEVAPMLHVPITRLAFVRRAFASDAPRLWNSLPGFVRRERRYHVFKRMLKAYLVNSSC